MRILLRAVNWNSPILWNQITSFPPWRIIIGGKNVRIWCHLPSSLNPVFYGFMLFHGAEFLVKCPFSLRVRLGEVHTEEVGLVLKLTEQFIQRAAKNAGLYMDRKWMEEVIVKKNILMALFWVVHFGFTQVFRIFYQKCPPPKKKIMKTCYQFLLTSLQGSDGR